MKKHRKMKQPDNVRLIHRKGQYHGISVSWLQKLKSVSYAELNMEASGYCAWSGIGKHLKMNCELSIIVNVNVQTNFSSISKKKLIGHLILPEALILMRLIRFIRNLFFVVLMAVDSSCSKFSHEFAMGSADNIGLCEERAVLNQLMRYGSWSSADEIR